ncbi:type I-C CRISPR-associated protein Cas8c/Csd1 [Paludisphaera borealis]|uniref:Uncharacterized protein n=1 Tax=Paludisphaera borealis TaxID=1387353 RepID=A0A1U7CWE3_9BACT|nr:type I-C CRISPR-associated protein Cas8c/Csd1 [Paludisphaera borealis]APW63226.1 hypothetical protein BSF38_04790 [Paludisphaera borealis]MDR3619245.1 type I-C CRISPR-associated protein Cas8c/Csd1 [Paludisphaera borealis]
MTQPLGSPLPALISYYNRLEADPNQMVAGFGFSLEKIHFQVVLESDGTFVSLDDIRERSDRGKPIPLSRLVPDGGGRSGTGLKPFFCWDNTGYTLGRDNKGKPERAAEMFAAFRDLHLSFREELGGDQAFAALCRFLEKWDPARAESESTWSEAAGLNVVFKVRGHAAFVHQSDTVKAAWLRRQAADNQTEGRVHGVSLVSGQREEIARLHPLLSGVIGANTMGAAIVSFNASSFESYGKSQSYNAPVGAVDVFRYTTALNRLLADKARRVSIGDATVVFWSDRAEAADAEEIAQQFFIEPVAKDVAAEDGKMISRLWEFLKAARQGRLEDHVSDSEAPFYVLGLSPNASRLSVRYWLATTVRQFAERLERHAADLEIAGARPGAPPLVIRGMVAEIMPQEMTSDSQKRYAAQLAGEIARAVLGGLPRFPEALLNSIVRRIRSDGVMSWRRASILKAFLKREGSFDVDVYLNKEHPEKAYHCGRLLAVLAFAQEQALGKVNGGVVRRNLGSVMATPGLMLGRLQRAAEIGHIPKLEGDLPDFVRDELKDINVRLQDDVPSRLSLRQQSLFALGFYQQLQYLDYTGGQVKANKRWRTPQGEWARSKLEVKVAEALQRFKLVYMYEPRALLDEGERWPDFVVRRGRGKDLFIEVLGMNTPEYNNRWDIKQHAYERFGITREGGPEGRLIVLDFRDRAYNERVVHEALRPYFSNQEDSLSQEMQEPSND